ncbi:hypothetical protein F2Q68_00021457 [Brassica cretica]|uniref:Uncharacterized protein n=1 Tax=Brassica cretica TaxID=69181 RepID=A0A8S9FUN4_BRACR|nr:hypothetical protein F2Q68_00021457 [Brassica cretica]
MISGHCTRRRFCGNACGKDDFHRNTCREDDFVEAYSAPLTPALVLGSGGSFSSASSASVAFGYEGVWWFVALRESYKSIDALRLEEAKVMNGLWCSCLLLVRPVRRRSNSGVFSPGGRVDEAAALHVCSMVGFRDT